MNGGLILFASVEFIVIYFPIAISLLSIWGLYWAFNNKRKGYFLPLVTVNVGIITHYVGLISIRGFSGMGVSMIGAIILVISLIILTLMLIVDLKIRKVN